MTAYATLEGYRVTRVIVQLRQHGAWSADVEIDVAGELAAVVTLNIGSLALVGNVERGGAFAGIGAYRIVAGAAGWRTALTARAYRSNALKLSTVLTDAARESGETIAAGYTDRTIGTAFVREAGPASRVLDALVGRDGWHVGNDGVTVVGARPTGAVTAVYRVLNYDPSSRVAVIDTQEPEAFAPGRTIEVESSVLTIAAITVHVSRAGLRIHAECSDAPESSRLVRVLDELVARRVARQLTHLGTHEYRVVAQSGQLLDVAPRNLSKGLPPLSKVPQYPGVHGTATDARVGATVLVTFLNGDPTKPIVCGYERPDATGATATQIRLAGGTKKNARDDDPIEAGHLRFDDASVSPAPAVYWAPDVNGTPGAYVEIAATSGPPAPGTPGTPITGSITGGSDTVRS